MQKKNVVWIFVLTVIFLPLGILADNWLSSMGIYPDMYGGKINTAGTVIAFALALSIYLIVFKAKRKSDKENKNG